MEEIKELVKPLIEWLEKSGNPYTQITITIDHVRVTEDKFGFPVNKD